MTTASYGESSNGQTIDLVVGQRIEIRLPENPTTGFRWQLMTNDGAVCAAISDVFEEPAGPPGRGGEHSWMFAAAQPGECDIELRYRRRWAVSVEHDRTFRIHIRVEGAGHDARAFLA
ncbi:MAG: protease inhibitor I42 family protein [Rhodopila sp.]|nr:protease inhibitor I42 family protein [Rhodopila sp.]